MSPVLQGGETALHEAARRGHTGVIKTLIAAGADVNAANGVCLRTTITVTTLVALGTF